MITVKFEKRFTAGHLAHMTYYGQLSFPERCSAERWISAVMGKDIRQGSSVSHYVAAWIDGDFKNGRQMVTRC